MKFKLNACLIFTGTTIIFLVINLVTGNESIETSLIWQCLLISCVGSTLQMLAFDENIFKKTKYVIRSIIFCVTFLAFLTACAIGFKWFPTDIAGYWVTFILIFFVAFAGISIGFSVFYKVTGKKMNERLTDYQNKN